MYRFQRFLPRLTAVFLLCASSLWAQADELLVRVVDDFQAQNWGVADDTRVIADMTPQEGGLQLDIPYSGKGFEFFRMVPVEPIAVPGQLKKVSVRIHMSEPGAASKLLITDGYGRGKDYDLRGVTPGEWSTATTEIPADLVQPVTIQGLLFHNYGTRNQKTDVKVGLSDLTVETDLSKADADTGQLLSWQPNPEVEGGEIAPETPLLIANFGSTRPGNFFAGEEPELLLSIRNWRIDPAQIRTRLEIFDEAGNVIYQDDRSVTVEATETLSWKPEIKAFGPYEARLQMVRAGDSPIAMEMSFAKAPEQPELSEAEKLASPYGMNYHAGHGLLLEPFREAGIVWYRDYAFAWDWLERAKGDNYSFSGWPGYPGIIKAYNDAGAMVMPCLMKAIPRPEIVNGEVENTPPPDRDWASHLVSVLLGFPHIQYWELDNEYELDGEIRRAEEMMDWAHYERYHERFAEIVDVIGQGELMSVENGRAGIFPDLVVKAVDNGSFAELDVVNIHHYCGIDAPEENVKNFNTGGLGAQASSYFDNLRATVAAADRDGKDREVFITEFGWDTLAGQVVSEAQQAAYLARAYMMHAAAGIDKSFWYWHFDAENATTFFGGCGLMDHNREPKPALVAMAGLTSVLPQLDYVGNFNAGPGTLGYVFRKDDGQLVAALWRISEGETPISFDFGPGVKLRDLYGNPFPGTEAVLGIAPVYAVGVSPDSAVMKQASYSIASDVYMPTTAGEEAIVRVGLQNLREEAIQGSLEIRLPEGWSGPDGAVPFAMAVGETGEADLLVAIPNGVPTGVYPMQVVVYEAGASDPITVLPLDANVRQPFYLSVGNLPVKEGLAELTATLVNQSNSPKSPEVSLALPSTWKAVSEPKTIENMVPGEPREVTMSLEWNADIPQGEKAEWVVATETASVAAPIIPPVIRIQKLDRNPGADVQSWPAANRLPDWMLGSTYAEPRTEVALGWSDEGLWVGVKVDDSKVYVTDPRSFWKGDVLEIFLDTDDDKSANAYGKGDHQFWIVAQPGSNDVYLGQWKRGDEIENTRMDIGAVEGASSLTETGYVMEFVIPWSEIEGGRPAAGSRMGLSLNLAVKGTDGDREVFWPRLKTGEVMSRPSEWGSVILAE